MRTVALLSAAHLGPEVIVHLGQGLSLGVRTAAARVVSGWRREVALPRRVVAVHPEEGGDARRFRGLVAYGELGEWETGRPVILEIAYMSQEVLFYDGIHMLCLAVRFGVERGGQAVVGPEPVTEPLPECGDKLGPVIRDDGLGQAVEVEDVLDEQVCQAGCVDSLTASP